VIRACPAAVLRPDEDPGNLLFPLPEWIPAGHLFLPGWRIRQKYGSGFFSQLVPVQVDTDPGEPAFEFQPVVVLVQLLNYPEPGFLIEVLGMVRIPAEGQAQAVQPFSAFFDFRIDHSATSFYIHIRLYYQKGSFAYSLYFWKEMLSFEFGRKSQRLLPLGVYFFK
jgi:hypothetical protein